MKRLIVFLSIIFSSLLTYAQTQDVRTEYFKVEGNCNMCKKRIEDAAYTKGVKRAEWDKATHMLTVTYRPSKTNAKAILTAVAKAGHTSQQVAATEEAYNKLPECCHYKTNSCEH